MLVSQIYFFVITFRPWLHLPQPLWLSATSRHDLKKNYQWYKKEFKLIKHGYPTPIVTYETGKCRLPKIVKLTQKISFFKVELFFP